MGIIEDLSNALTPHADKLNKTVGTVGMAILNQLQKIEKATVDLGKPDVGDKWFRINFKKEIKEKETVELYECPINEILRIQSICSDGTQEKSPAFIVTIDNASLIYSLGKEFLGTETPGGDILLMPGESLLVTARATGNFSFTINCVRRRLPTEQHQDHTGEPSALFQGRNLHEPDRDVIESSTGQWTDESREVQSVGT